MAACKRSGDFQTVLNYSEVTVSWNYNPYPSKVFSVEINEQLITDSLMFQNDDPGLTRATQHIMGDQPLKKFVLKEVPSGTVVLDTMINISGITKIALLALSVTDKPAIAGGGEQPTDPVSRDSAKYSYVYNDPKLPDSVLLKLYIGDGNLLPEYVPDAFDSVVLKRNEFSRYISFPWNDYEFTSFYFEILDAKSKEYIQRTDPNTFAGYAYGLSMGNNFGAPTAIKFTQVLIRFAAPDEPDPFRQERYYDQILSETRW